MAERQYNCVRCQNPLWYHACIWHDEQAYCAACVVDYLFGLPQRGQWVRISIANLKSWLDHAEERGKINAELEL